MGPEILLEIPNWEFKLFKGLANLQSHVGGDQLPGQTAETAGLGSRRKATRTKNHRSIRTPQRS